MSVECWCVRLDGSPDRYYATLSRDELDRSARFRFERHRRRFVVARGALRAILGQALDTDAGKLRFVYNSFGKPALGPELGSTLKFNLSHSADLAVIAITTNREVGVDIEMILPESGEPPTFFEEWTRREAYVKARGEGLSDGPIEFREGWSLRTFRPAPGYAGALAIEDQGVRTTFPTLRLSWMY